MTKKKFLIGCLVIALVHVALILWYGVQKSGFHEDELYSYYSSAGEAQLLPIGGIQWRSGYDMQSQFMVTEDDQFDFETVIQNQVEDVHPPLYYLTLNIVMSLFAGSFYKWFGILLNLVYSLAALAGIFFLICRVDFGKNRYWFAWVGGAVYAVAPAAVSNVMLTRMYTMSAMWTVCYACVIAELFRSERCSRKKFALLTAAGALVCYLSFLTHYFCLFNAFFLTLFYVIYVLICRHREIVRTFLYGIAMLVGIGLAVWTFPASMDHIFGGYRGEGALDGLLNTGLFELTKLFLPYIDDSVFAGMLPAVVIVVSAAVVLWIVYAVRRRDENVSEQGSLPLYAIQMLASLCAFYVLTRTSLMVGDVACRYFYPVITMLLPLGAYAVAKACSLLMSGHGKFSAAADVLALCLVMVPMLAGHIQDNVLFLYREDAEKVAFSEENSEYPFIVIYDQDVSYRSWYIVNQLWPCQKILYMNLAHTEYELVDETLMEAEKVIIYMDCGEDVIEKILKESTNLSTYTMVRHDAFFYVYVLE